MKLKEGKSYLFTVAKTIRFEGKDYFVFQGPDGRRYLVPAHHYENYNIKLGDKISCRVDKINCKGEVFLEPEHPYYREGNSYLFEVTGSDIRVDRSGKRHEVYTVIDRYYNEISVPLIFFESSVPSVGERIELVIGRIEKGHIIFNGLAAESGSEKEEGETLHEFFIIEVVKGLDGKEYYLVSDSKGGEYTLPKDYYRHYGFSPGKKFKGRFIRYKAGEKVRIEPQNPFFTPGQSYTFRFVELIELNAGIEWVSVVLDEYGFRHNVDVNLGLEDDEEVILKVERIRKGWPLLKPV